MDNLRAGLFSEMESPDSGTSSMDSLSFENWGRLIFSLLEDNTVDEDSTILQQQPESLKDFFVTDKLNYFNKVCANIMETKNNFLQNMSTINRSIEEMTREIVLQVHVREQELKNQLWRIKSKKVSKWDRQLSVCEEASKRLKLEKRFSSNQVTTEFDYSWTKDLTKELEYVDAGEVKFQCEDFQDLLKSLKNFGSISSHVDSNWRDMGFYNFKSLTPKFVFGSTGAKPGQFCRPWGVCSDRTGRILVCDRSNHRIQIFNECGKFVISFGGEGSQPGKFNRPSGIDVDNKCRIIVADKDNHRIQVFTYSGCYMFEFGTQGTKPGQFMYPWDVSVNSSCDIAVSDSKNHRVQLFNEDGLFITLIDAERMGIQDPRTRLRFLDSPRGLAFRPDGNLLVTDFNNHRVLLIDRNFNKFSTCGFEGLNAGEFLRPQGIACDASGRFAVSDSKNYRVQVFDGTGKFLKAFGSKGIEPGQFDCPQGVSFHPNQDIIVVDLSNNRVQVF